MVLEQPCGGISGFRFDYQIAAEWIHGFGHTVLCHTRCLAHHTTAIKDERSITFLHAAHCGTPTASTASCWALGRLRNDARSSGFIV